MSEGTTHMFLILSYFIMLSNVDAFRNLNRDGFDVVDVDASLIACARSTNKRREIMIDLGRVKCDALRKSHKWGLEKINHLNH